MSRIASLVAAILLASCSRPPTAPQVGISPTEPTTLDDLVAELLDGSGDPDRGDVVAYNFWWSLDGEAVATGATLWADETAKGQTWTVSVVASDGDLQSRASSASVTILNTPPSVEIEFAEVDPLPTDDLALTVHGYDLDGDDVGLDYEWRVDGEIFLTDERSISAADTRQDQVWEVTVTPNDGEEDGEPATASVRIGNRSPVVEALAIEPADPTEASTLSGVVEASDADGDEVSLSWSWQVNGSEVSTEPTLDGSLFDKHDQVVLVATPTDGWAEGEAVSSEAVTVADTAPSISGVSLDPGEIYEATTLTCVPGAVSDLDGDAVELSYTWIVNGDVVGTGATADGSLFDRGDEVSCSAVPGDGELEGEAVVAEAAFVRNTPPILSGASLSTLVPDESTTLSVIPAGATDDDGDAIRYGYAWYVDGDLVSTASTVDGDDFDRGDEVYAVVTPSDGMAEGPAVMSDVATVANTPPTITDLQLTPDPAYTDDTLTLSVETLDADGDAVFVSYAWYVNGSRASILSRLEGTAFDKGDEVYVVLTPRDDDDTGDSVASDSLVISNTPPSIEEVTLDPGVVYEADTVSCLVSGEQDTDGDVVALGYRWTVNGEEVSTSSAIDGADFDRGDVLVCIVTPWDGEEQGEAVSASVTVSNTPPVLESATLSSDSPREGDTLSVVLAGASDDDGDAIAYARAWYVNGALVSRRETLDGADFDKGDEIYATVTPYDGADSGGSVTTDTATAVNTPPQVTAIDLSSSYPFTDDLLSAAVTTSDADGDSVSLTWAWFVNGEPFSTSTGLDGSTDFDRGDLVYVVVTPDDGEEAGASATSETARVSNSPPTAPVLSLSPAEPESTDDLVCLVETESVDADGDSISYSFAWEVDGEAYTAAWTTTWAGDTVPADATVDGEEWTCTVTPDDGGLTGASDSAGVTVGRAPWSGAWDLDDDTAYQSLIYGEDASDSFGGGVSSADLDGDGVPDLIVGASGDDTGRSGGGAAYVFSGPISAGVYAADEIYTAKVWGNSTGSFGTAVFGLSDVNGDGYDDMYVARDTLSAAFFFYGPVTGSFEGTSGYDFYESGGCVRPKPAGNFYTASSSDEWICGYPQNVTSRGRTRVYSGITQVLELTGVSSYDSSGSEVEGNVDADGDGRPDLLIAAPGRDTGGTDSGTVYLVYGPASGTMSLSSADQTILGDGAGDNFGGRMDSSTDATGDGASDVAIAARYEDSGGADAGAVYVYDHIGSATRATHASATIYGGAAGDYLASGVSFDDVDGDGIDDLLVCSPNAESGVGAAWLFYGPIEGTYSVDSDEDAAFYGVAASDSAGNDCRLTGDMDGNGRSELAIGSVNGDGPSATDHGAVYLFPGR